MDPIAEMITIIKNAQSIKRDKVEIPFSTMKFEVAKILKEQGVIRDCKKIKEKLMIKLKYSDAGMPKIEYIKRVSKPSRRIYVNHNQIPKVKSGLGFVIISTSQGLMAGGKAQKLGIGGEIICKVW